jgi:hypothetical protein
MVDVEVENIAVHVKSFYSQLRLVMILLSCFEVTKMWLSSLKENSMGMVGIRYDREGSYRSPLNPTRQVSQPAKTEHGKAWTPWGTDLARKAFL